MNILQSSHIQLVFAVVVTVLLSLSGCNHAVQNSFNGEVRYIASFDTLQTLLGNKLPYIKSFYFYGCEVYYPYLLLSLAKQDSLLAVYDLETKEFIGNYFSIGGGPDDFRSFVITNQSKSSILTVNDIYNKKLKMICLPKTFNNKQVVYEKILAYEGVHEMVFSVDSMWWMKSVLDGEITYTCSESGFPPKMLYKESIGRMDLDNMLVLSDAIKPDGSKIVSLSGILDQIDILSLHTEEKNFSVTTSQELVTIQQLQDNNYRNVREYFLAVPRCNDSYIMALHVCPDTNQKSLYVIDWNGKGVANYLIDEDIVDFCVDWDRELIYGITESEEVYEYNFKLVGC